MSRIRRISPAGDSACPSGPCLSFWALITRPPSSHRAKCRKKVDRVVRFVLFLLGTLTANRLGQREAAWYRADDPYGRPEPATLQTGPRGPDDGVARPDQTRPLPPWRPR